MTETMKTIPLSRIGLLRPKTLGSIDNPFYTVMNESNEMVYELHIVPDSSTYVPRGYVGAYHDAVGLITWYDMVKAVTLAQIEDTWDEIVEECEMGRDFRIL